MKKKMNAATLKKDSVKPAEGLDKLKKTAAFSLIAVALFVFYFLSEDLALLFRVLGLVFAFSMAVVLYALTENGKNTFAFLWSSRQELHRVTWPTRTETLQTTLLILAVVFIIAIFFWLVDMILGWLVQLLIA